MQLKRDSLVEIHDVKVMERNALKRGKDFVWKERTFETKERVRSKVNVHVREVSVRVSWG